MLSTSCPCSCARKTRCETRRLNFRATSWLTAASVVNNFFCQHDWQHVCAPHGVHRRLDGARKLVQLGAALVVGAAARRETSEPRILPLAALWKLEKENRKLVCQTAHDVGANSPRCRAYSAEPPRCLARHPWFMFQNFAAGCLSQAVFKIDLLVINDHQACPLAILPRRKQR